MARDESAAKASGEERNLENADLSDEECRDRCLVLRREPPSRKEQLVSDGVKEVRCVCCMRIRPLAGCEELGEGWICEDCVSELRYNRRCAG